MAGIVTIKAGALFGTIAPGGFVLLAAIHSAAQALDVDLTITSGTDGMHSGYVDPHHRGEAYDIRTHDLSPDMKQKVLEHIQMASGPAFFSFIENPGGDDEHIHCQVKKGTKYPVEV